MTAKQILDAFSETLMQDERILSPRERELLMSLLQNSRAISGSDPQTQSAVTAAIARSVGETVAQRAFGLLGGSIVEQILAGSGTLSEMEETMPASIVPVSGPQPPRGPQPPSVRKPEVPVRGRNRPAGRSRPLVPDCPKDLNHQAGRSRPPVPGCPWDRSLQVDRSRPADRVVCSP